MYFVFTIKFFSIYAGFGWILEKRNYTAFNTTFSAEEEKVFIYNDVTDYAKLTNFIQAGIMSQISRNIFIAGGFGLQFDIKQEKVQVPDGSNELLFNPWNVLMSINLRLLYIF